MKGTSIKTDRLVEVAMYAPQWIDMIQEYLGWNGLKSGCYYFMAHMNERFEESKQAMIAKYTPLTVEELQTALLTLTGSGSAMGFWERKISAFSTRRQNTFPTGRSIPGPENTRMRPQGK